MNDSQIMKKLLATVAALRDPDTGCPWDIQQTHTSLKPYLLEECYELLDAIDQGCDNLKEELGDVLLQVLLHAQIASETNKFNFSDVMTMLTNKLISRHPHVFGSVKADSVVEALQYWNAAKDEEKRSDGDRTESLLGDISDGTPATMKAEKMGSKASKVGFDWKTAKDILCQVKEELSEYIEAYENSDTDSQEEELGDLLFTLVQHARKSNLSAEAALQRACAKFKKRFQDMELNAPAKLSDLTNDELEILWKKSKLKKT